MMRILRCGALCLAVGLPLAVACGTDSGGSVTPPAGDSLLVTSVTPHPGGTDMDPLAPLTAGFDRALDPATVGPDAIGLTTGVDSLLTSPLYSALNQNLTITAPLLPGTSYQATIRTSLLGSAGEALAQPYGWSFSTLPWNLMPLGPVAQSRGLALQISPARVRHLVQWAPGTAGDSLLYLECAAGCADPAHWTTTGLLTTNTGGPLALALGTAGALHLVYQDASSADLIYATCASACTIAASWTFSTALDLASSDGYSGVGLALDGTNRVHLVTSIALQQDFGVAYGTCAAACLDPANWQAVTLDSSASSGDAPALAVNAAGVVHVLQRQGGTGAIRYHTCAAACLTVGNWQATSIGGGLGLTRPALVQGFTGELHAFFGDAAGGVMYLRCPAGCTAPAGWSGEVLEPPGNYGVRLALVVGRSGRIHALYQDQNLTALRYATCASGCTAATHWARLTLAPGLNARNIVLGIDGTEEITGAVEDFATGNLRLVP